MPTDPLDPTAPAPVQPTSGLFGSREPAPQPRSLLPWVIAGAVVVLLVIVLALAGRHKAAPAANVIQPLASYADKVVFSGLVMSESTSLSGGKSTYIDGHIRNAGDKTLTSATVQVIFHNEEAMPPQVETLPLTLIRTRQPYVDTQQISDAPVKPGEDREFRLIFENIATNWNQQTPEIHLIGAETR